MRTHPLGSVTRGIMDLRRPGLCGTVSLENAISTKKAAMATAAAMKYEEGSTPAYATSPPEEKAPRESPSVGALLVIMGPTHFGRSEDRSTTYAATVLEPSPLAMPWTSLPTIIIPGSSTIANVMAPHIDTSRIIIVAGRRPRWSEMRGRKSRGTTVPSRYHMDAIDSCACVMPSSSCHIEYSEMGEPDVK